MWPITQSSPTTVGCSVVVCNTQLSCTLVRSPMRDLAVVAAQHGTRPHRAVGADRHGADHHGIGMHIGIGDGWTEPDRRGHRWARPPTVVSELGTPATAHHGGAKRLPPDTVAGLCPEGSKSSSPARARTARGRGAWPERRSLEGVLDGSLLPDGAKIGSVLKADAEVELDGITILSVATTKEKADEVGPARSDRQRQAVRGCHPAARQATTATTAATVATAVTARRHDGGLTAIAGRDAMPATGRRDARASGRDRRSPRRRPPSWRASPAPTGAAPVPIVARAPSGDASEFHGPARAAAAAQSRSGSSPAVPTATRCSPSCPRSSARSPSAPCRVACRRFARPSTNRTPG